jgi:hypothetical protein
MDAKTKWLLNQELTYQQGLEILKELYDGAKKRFDFCANQEINENIYHLFSDFESNELADVHLTFSNTKTTKPFVSCSEIKEENVSHKIKTDRFVIYIYE